MENTPEPEDIKKDLYWDPQKRQEEAFEDDTDYPVKRWPEVVNKTKGIVEMPLSSDKYKITDSGNWVSL